MNKQKEDHIIKNTERGRTMKQSSEIIGLPVVSITEAKELGTIKELLINPAEGSIAAVVLDDGQWYYGAKLILFNDLEGIGEYAATVKNSSVIIPIAAAADLEALLVANVKVIGSKVLTSSGRIQGKVTEFYINDAGKIANCEVVGADGGTISVPAQNIYTFGKEVLVVADIDCSVTETSVTETNDGLDFQKQSIETRVQIPGSEVNLEGENSSMEDDDPAKKFDDKHRKFLLGKKSNRRIETDNGVLIVDAGGEITEEVLQKAKLAGKFVELSMSIQ